MHLHVSPWWAKQHSLHSPNHTHLVRWCFCHREGKTNSNNNIWQTGWWLMTFSIIAHNKFTGILIALLQFNAVIVFSKCYITDLSVAVFKIAPLFVLIIWRSGYCLRHSPLYQWIISMLPHSLYAQLDVVIVVGKTHKLTPCFRSLLLHSASYLDADFYDTETCFPTSKSQCYKRKH